jgi:hypothetical protein
MKRLLATFLTALAACVGYVAPASADIIFTFNQGLGGGPFGTVLLHQVGANQVQVTATLNAGVGFVNTGLQPFAFNNALTLVAGDFSGITGGFSVVIPSGNTDGQGSFQYGMNCTVAVCGTGGSGPFPGPLTFLVTHAGLTEASFTGNASGVFFAADICTAFTPGKGCSGATGEVGAKTPGTPPQAPEPGILSLLAIAVLGLGFTTMRRRTA